MPDAFQEPRMLIELSNELGESDPKAILRLSELLWGLGEQICSLLLERAKVIYASGGLRRADGSGNRTLGGIFFRLARPFVPRRSRTRSSPSTKWRPLSKSEEELITALRHMAACSSVAAMRISEIGGGQIPISRTLMEQVRALAQTVSKLAPRLILASGLPLTDKSPTPRISKGRKSDCSPKGRPVQQPSSGPPEPSDCGEVRVRTGRGDFYDSRLWRAPTPAEVSRNQRIAISGTVIDKLRFCRDGQRREANGSPLDHVHAARLLGVDARDLEVWAETKPRRPKVQGAKGVTGVKSPASYIGRTCINLNATHNYESIEPHSDDRRRFR